MIAALIPARSGSKGIKNKNMCLLNGKPLLFYTIQAAKMARDIDLIIVSSDGDSILEYARSQGVLALKRPDSISGDFATSQEVVLHTLECLNEGVLDINGGYSTSLDYSCNQERRDSSGIHPHNDNATCNNTNVMLNECETSLDSKKYAMLNENDISNRSNTCNFLCHSDNFLRHSERSEESLLNLDSINLCHSESESKNLDSSPSLANDKMPKNDSGGHVSPLRHVERSETSRNLDSKNKEFLETKQNISSIESTKVDSNTSPSNHLPQGEGKSFLESRFSAKSKKQRANNSTAQIEALILLQPTSPLRDSSDIDNAIEIFRKERADSLMSVVECDNKILKAFIENENGTLRGICNDSYPFMPRQKLPKTYLSNGAIYIIKPHLFIDNPTFLSANNSHYIMPKEKSIDIDSIEDLKIVESMLRIK